MKSHIAMFTVAASALLASSATADNFYEGTVQERHAQSIYTGVFGQCRLPTAEAAGVVSLVFAVKPSGRFEATSTFKESAGRDVLRKVAQCMGSKANQARSFPKSEDASLVGVKFAVESDGKLLMMGASETSTLSNGEMFQWARVTPTGPGA